MNLGAKGDIFVLTEEQRHVLMDYNRQWLLDHPPPRELGEDAGRSNLAATTPTIYDENTPDLPAH